MAPVRTTPSGSPGASAGFARLDRPTTLTARVEQMLRQAIAEKQFPDGRLPTEIELAAQLGVSRETVRLAAEALQREGLLVKIRRKGTFLQAPALPERIEMQGSAQLGYFQAEYEGTAGEGEGVTRVMNGLMLQGALEEAGRRGLPLVVQNAPHTRMGQVFRELAAGNRLRGAIFASFGEEKLFRKIAGRGMAIVLLDHDLHLPHVHTVRDDSSQGARDAVLYLAGLGHRRIGYVNWRQEDLNPWRLQGYLQGLREAGLARRRQNELSVELTGDGARQAVDRFLRLSPRPTALYCFNNTLARLLLRELNSRGIRVPDQVSVMGGGGEEAPGLACDQADWYQLGCIALQILIRALDAPGDCEPEHYLGTHTIRVDQTVGPPT